MTLTDAIHTNDTTAVINHMRFGINTRRFTIPGTKSTAVTLRLIDYGPEK